MDQYLAGLAPAGSGATVRQLVDVTDLAEPIDAGALSCRWGAALCDFMGVGPVSLSLALRDRIAAEVARGAVGPVTIAEWFHHARSIRIDERVIRHIMGHSQGSDAHARYVVVPDEDLLAAGQQVQKGLLTELLKGTRRCQDIAKSSSTSKHLLRFSEDSEKRAGLAQ
jgi:hypothetical protein